MSTPYSATRTAADTGVETAVVCWGEPPTLDSPASLLVTVDFGDGASQAVTTVAGFAFRRTSRSIQSDRPRAIAHVVGRPDAQGLDDEDAVLDGVTAQVCNPIDGVSFDVVANAPEGTTGLYEVQIIGV